MYRKQRNNGNYNIDMKNESNELTWIAWQIPPSTISSFDSAFNVITGLDIKFTDPLLTNEFLTNFIEFAGIAFVFIVDERSGRALLYTNLRCFTAEQWYTCIDTFFQIEK